MGLTDDLKPGPVALDTQIFIYFIEEEGRYLPLIKPLFEAIDRGELVGVSSGITVRRSKSPKSFNSEVFPSIIIIYTSRFTPHDYLTTLFARSSTRPGIVRPICFAALRFMTNSNFVACCTGKSFGLAPFKILST